MPRYKPVPRPRLYRSVDQKLGETITALNRWAQSLYEWAESVEEVCQKEGLYKKHDVHSPDHPPPPPPFENG